MYMSSGLYWLAFTTYQSVHWIVPIIASIPFGSGIFLVFTSVFTYLVTAYRPIAASAMASNSAMRSSFAAVFPLFAGYMYSRLGTVGATALLAGIMTLTVPLPYVHEVYLPNNCQDTDCARHKFYFQTNWSKITCKFSVRCFLADT